MKKINLFAVAFLIIFGNQIFAQRELTLEESINLTLQNNNKVKNSSLEIEAADQIKKSAFTNYFPNVSAGGMMFKADKSLMEMETEGGDLPVYDGNLENLGSATQFAYMPASSLGFLEEGTIGYINAVQPIFAGGRIINGNKLASLSEEVSEYRSNMAKDEAVLKTEEQYWQIVSLEEKLITIEKYEKLLKRLFEIVEDSYNSGIVMKNDVLKVKLSLSEVLLNKSKLNNGIKIAKMAFCQHIGIEYNSSLSLIENLAIKDTPESIYVENKSVVESRNEYKLLKLSVRAEELQTNMKLGEFLPEAGIGVTGQYLKFDDSDSRTLGMLFGTVSVPISNWWGGAHELEERSIKEDIAENNFKNNSELLLLQMERVWQELTEAYTQYLLSDETKKQAEENLKVNDDSYNNGIIPVSDLLEAQAELQRANDQLTEAKANYLIKRTTYLQVTGR